MMMSKVSMGRLRMNHKRETTPQDSSQTGQGINRDLNNGKKFGQRIDQKSRRPQQQANRGSQQRQNQLGSESNQEAALGAYGNKPEQQFGNAGQQNNQRNDQFESNTSRQSNQRGPFGQQAQQGQQTGGQGNQFGQQGQGNSFKNIGQNTQEGAPEQDQQAQQGQQAGGRGNQFRQQGQGNTFQNRGKNPQDGLGNIISTDRYGAPAQGQQAQQGQQSGAQGNQFQQQEQRNTFQNRGQNSQDGRGNIASTDTYGAPGQVQQPNQRHNQQSRNQNRRGGNREQIGQNERRDNFNRQPSSGGFGNQKNQPQGNTVDSTYGAPLDGQDDLRAQNQRGENQRVPNHQGNKGQNRRGQNQNGNTQRPNSQRGNGQQQQNNQHQRRGQQGQSIGAGSSPTINRFLAASNGAPNQNEQQSNIEGQNFQSDSGNRRNSNNFAAQGVQPGAGINKYPFASVAANDFEGNFSFEDTLICPGGTVEACIRVCPGNTAQLYGGCVQGCADRCNSPGQSSQQGGQAQLGNLGQPGQQGQRGAGGKQSREDPQSTAW